MTSTAATDNAVMAATAIPAGLVINATNPPAFDIARPKTPTVLIAPPTAPPIFPNTKKAGPIKAIAPATFTIVFLVPDDKLLNHVEKFLTFVEILAKIGVTIGKIVLPKSIMIFCALVFSFFS